MKTAILTIALFTATIFGFNTTSFAATGNGAGTSTVLPDVAGIDQIEVHGNVELYLSDGQADKVKVYSSYYDQGALVQDQNGVLRLSNYSKQKLVVWVTAKDLRNVNVYDNASVQSFGSLSFIDLDVRLFDHAFAKLNLDTFTASITLNNRAKADLSGSVDKAVLRYDWSSFLNTRNLSAASITKTVNFRHPEFNDQPELASL